MEIELIVSQHTNYLDAQTFARILRHMTKHEPNLDSLFRALADTTRRAVLARLALGPASVGELAKPFDMALPTLLQHIRKLEQGGLIETSKQGRVRHCALCPQAMEPIESWIDTQRNIWSGRIDQLDSYIETLNLGLKMADLTLHRILKAPRALIWDCWTQLRLKFEVRHRQPRGHRMLPWKDTTSTWTPRNVA